MEYVYESKYTDRKVRPDGYLVEVFMTRKYNRKGKVLPQKFWNDPEYKSEFFANLSTARSIFKTYENRGISNKLIIAALTRKDAHNVIWLKDERVDSLIEAEIKRQRQDEQEKYKVDSSDCSNEKPRKPYTKKSTLSKLRELDG